MTLVPVQSLLLLATLILAASFATGNVTADGLDPSAVHCEYEGEFGGGFSADASCEVCEEWPIPGGGSAYGVVNCGPHRME